MDIYIKDMIRPNEDSLTYNCLLSFHDKEVWLTLPADSVSLNDIVNVLYYEYYQDEWVNSLENLKDILPMAEERQLLYIYENKTVWLEELKKIMTEEEMKEYFESFEEEVVSEEDIFDYLDNNDSYDDLAIIEELLKENEKNN